MDLSGIIFVVLALAWAVYLIPKALKHHDEIARTRSVDRFSHAMRVLARREAVGEHEARLVVTPPRTPDAVRASVLAGADVSDRNHASALAELPDDSADAERAATASERGDDERAAPAEKPAAEPGPRVPTAEQRARARARAHRQAARLAARRRRRVLQVLLVAVAGNVAAAGLGAAPWWSVTVPTLVVVGFLFLCRHQVRRATGALEEGAPVASAPPSVPRPAVRVDSTYGSGWSAGRVSPDEEETVALSTASLAAAMSAGSASEADAAAQASVSEGVAAHDDGGSLWDPLPITLPTYVGKRRAARTVRNIDLNEPGAWTSGRSESDSQLVEEVAAEVTDEAADATEGQRAVGS